jgi:hypothetical protein
MRTSTTFPYLHIPVLYCQFLWIVHLWLALRYSLDCFYFILLCPMYPMLPVSLDCPFPLSLRYSLTFICPVSCVSYGSENVTFLFFINKHFYTVGTKWNTKKNTTLSEQNEKQKSTTLSEQNEKQKIPYCLNKMKNKNNTCRNKMKNNKYYTVGKKEKQKHTTL